MSTPEMLERDTEVEEEARQAAAAQAAALSMLAQPAPDMTALWNTTSGWAGPAPTLINLTDSEDDDAA